MEQPETVLKLAFAAHNQGRQAEAEAMCRSMVEAGSPNSQLFFLLGMVLHKTGRSSEAAGWLERAAELQPGDARVFSGLGLVWKKLGVFTKAADCFARAAQLEPQNANHYYHLGNTVYQLNELERATDAFQSAVELNPKDAESWNNLGKCYKELNRIADSIAAYDHALAINPGYLLALQGRSISLLTSGRLAEGYRDYELRWLTLKPRDLTGPRWAGQDIPGKTLFLHAEQGFGDGIQSARYPKLVRQHCGRVILECRPELKKLFAFSDVADQVIAYGEPVPPHDFYNSIVSVPGLLNVSLSTIPGEVPYLKAPVSATPLPSGDKNFKVGLVWAGSPTHSDDANRSLPLRLLAPVLAVPGVSFYGLQLPVPERDREALLDFPQLNVLDTFQDYLATASVVAELDLIISVDTSVAHLAGALRKPVWTLIQFAPDWRWFAQFGDHTPWYPTMRLFRQPRRCDWKPVVDQVALELPRHAKSHDACCANY